MDRDFGCCSWHNRYTDVCVDYLSPSLSDHSPLLLDCNVVGQKGSRPLKFCNYMDDHSGFHQVFQEGWNTVVLGTVIFQVWQKLKVVKQGLKSLHHKEFTSLQERIDSIIRGLDDVKSQLATTPLMLYCKWLKEITPLSSKTSLEFGRVL